MSLLTCPIGASAEATARLCDTRRNAGQARQNCSHELKIQSVRIGGEGGITRRCAPRPFGAALRALKLLKTRSDRPRHATDQSGRVIEPSGRYPTPSLRRLGSGIESSDFSSLFLVSERVGFEPTCRNYPTIRFRVGAVMTTSVPLQWSPFGGWYSS
jgi:hypothetical protein